MVMNKTRFFGRNLNRIRGHYFWLRRKLGMKKALDTIKKIGKCEKRIVNDIIHKISREIVNSALETNAIIILGNIKYLRKRIKDDIKSEWQDYYQDFHTTN